MTDLAAQIVVLAEEPIPDRIRTGLTPPFSSREAAALAAAGLVTLSAEKEGGAEFAAVTPALLARDPEFRSRLQEALDLTKPAFNEEMRAGHTNM